MKSAFHISRIILLLLCITPFVNHKIIHSHQLITEETGSLVFTFVYYIQVWVSFAFYVMLYISSFYMLNFSTKLAFAIEVFSVIASFIFVSQLGFWWILPSFALTALAFYAVKKSTLQSDVLKPMA
jgi:hypothetical protein